MFIKALLKLSTIPCSSSFVGEMRLVRFYAYEGLLSKPERAPDDRRKANFGPLQVRQLLLARLLAERGWDLDRIRTLLHDSLQFFLCGCDPAVDIEVGLAPMG